MTLGSTLSPPAHVPAYVLPASDAMQHIGGALWTLSYALYGVEGARTQSYGMPLLAIANNLAFDAFFGLALASAPAERTAFLLWAGMQLGLVYALLMYGRNEWVHAPAVQRNLPRIFATALAGCSVAHWAAARWWISRHVGAHRGKMYAGRVGGPDMAEMCFWDALVSQVYLSLASLAQLIVRGHTGGVSWPVWATRAFGSAVGSYAYYVWRWYFWPEVHEYVVNPLALVLMASAALADAAYAFVLAHVRKTERVSMDGRKTAGITELSVRDRKG